MAITASILLQGFIAGASGYIYTQDRKDVPTQEAYVFSKKIPVCDNDGVSARIPSDMAVAPDGTFYIADTGNNRILILDENNTIALSSFRLPDGSKTTLNEPEGICFLSDGYFLVADTMNGRLLKSDSKGNVLQVFNKPEGMPGVKADMEFLPTKVDVDSMGRLYVIARNINQGLICIDETGYFNGFVGAPRVQPDLLELIWRMFSTKAQIAQMTQYVSTEFNNVFIDSQNFVWGTVSDKKALSTESTPPVSKINSAGIDVLKRNGFHPPVGDMIEKGEPSRIIDVAMGPKGVYSLLDFQRGHVFAYDDNGNLLFIFGGKGLFTGGMVNPSALHWQDNDIAVLDSDLSEILVYKPSTYGQMVLDAAGAQFEGNYDEAYRLWSEVARNNVNFQHAFVGMGYVYMDEKKYDQAMAYFKYAGQRQLYSEAHEAARRETLERIFPYIFAGIIMILFSFIIRNLVKRILRYIRGGRDA